MGWDEYILVSMSPSPPLYESTSLALAINKEEPQSRFGGKPLKFQVVCPQNGTAVLKGLPRRSEALLPSCQIHLRPLLPLPTAITSQHYIICGLFIIVCWCEQHYFLAVLYKYLVLIVVLRLTRTCLKENINIINNKGCTTTVVVKVATHRQEVSDQ